MNYAITTKAEFICTASSYTWAAARAAKEAITRDRIIDISKEEYNEEILNQIVENQQYFAANSAACCTSTITLQQEFQDMDHDVRYNRDIITAVNNAVIDANRHKNNL